ncbi:PEP-CTERM sorting domain-containing protein [Aetokthonos hydrillicola Thurmond2011]|jgi:hypothetical protein|uniref:PEP-CTERM sorting domain-containing protein n=1 Tax=Aetokthonos hydrillicola Thurmond2011 TaxID=2712845 RepID=A0AAP5MAT5_9CYAN|nr:choice-of-anchor W domain-containing protein [Aetokthonos hydrillicola]MBO3463902.1 PEP-CTERM sorting domain-containing protein [Aetokthonos hydrillicola CCALA 1050]MBW4584317.1 PEP-CTERM sorting domain-containing protein [Aetokthonos hydrillicola CCALA 1050]MDR9898475.1 PEP-CTERM sorting domain-containing protein [Aetokthonos hydrillicola Thurmond2011]
MLYKQKFANHLNPLIIAVLAALGLFLVPHSAKAFTLVNRTSLTDADFNNILDQGTFKELFVAEGRIGNNSLNDAERELGINRNARALVAPGEPVASGQFVWGNGTPVDFTLNYTGSTINYTVGGQTLTTTAFNGPVNDIYLRTFATQNSTATLSDLVFKDLTTTNTKFTIGSLSSTGTSTPDTDYLEITDISDPFEITGKVALSWTGIQPPTRSNLAYQIKVGGSSSVPPIPRQVPESGTTGAILLTGIAGIGYRCRKRFLQFQPGFHK